MLKGLKAQAPRIYRNLKELRQYNRKAYHVWFQKTFKTRQTYRFDSIEFKRFETRLRDHLEKLKRQTRR